MAVQPLIGITVSDQPNDLAERYIAAIEAAGGRACLLRPAGGQPELDQLGGIILSGGVPDIDPERYSDPLDPRTVKPDSDRDAYELRLVEAAGALDMPILGICRGFQLLNVAFGGKLTQHIDGHSSVNDVSGQHWLDVMPGSLLARTLGAYGPIKVNSRHHQAVRPPQSAPRLRPVGYSPDGLVEALESMDHRWVLGLQCHPERADEVDARFAAVFQDFVRTASES